MGRIPPDKDHPLYNEWLRASVRHLKTKQRLEGMSPDDPHYAAAYLECLGADKAYETMVAKITARVQTQPGLLP